MLRDGPKAAPGAQLKAELVADSCCLAQSATLFEFT
jgi:hypothetical protein